ncbi:amidohydrolase [Nafulsella turpanensis]|uniref:amidohydrolase n=1 Tax=Nafulsella turpanensis TaxID=1265690 RepID=UPI000349B8B5|nr:amidohydrolase [Nafulsella turpanensis]
MSESKWQEVDLDELVELRHRLHKHPSLSGEEASTAQIIKSFLKGTNPTQIVQKLGGHGLAFVYESDSPGPSIGFRCELDALPIHEKTDLHYASSTEGVSHKCGHDGHMAILAGLGRWIQAHPPQKGKVVLLFQPAEETGQGAAAVIKDKKWKEIKPDWLFGLHNIPGKAAGEIYWKEGHFCAASKGLSLRLKGCTSHAAEPEKGRNPAKALANIMLELQALPEQKNTWKDLVLVTPVYARLGEKAYGTSAGYAEFGATLRTIHEEDMVLLSQRAHEIIEKYCKAEKLSCECNYLEDFPATVNQAEPLAYVRKAIESTGLQNTLLKEPFRWSEDFGHYHKSCPTTFVGLGAGEKQAPLHHPDYDFPDAIIGKGLQLFTGIIREVQSAHEKKN